MSKNNEKPEGGYRVGYGKPPAHSRFRKGQSGNPTGQRRPTSGAERLRKVISEEAYRLLTVREGEDIKRIAAARAVLRSQIASAVKGNVSAQRAIIQAIQQVEAEPQPHRSTVAANQKKKDVREMTDEELMDIIRAARNRKS